MSFFERFKRKPSERDNFVEAILAKMKVLPPSYQNVYDKNEFSIKVSKDGAEILTANLANIYSAYQGMGNVEKLAFIERMAKTFCESIFLDIPETFREASEKLVPMLRSRAYFANVNFNDKNKGNPPTPYRVIGEDMAVGIGLNRENSIPQVNEEALAKWKVSFEDCLSVAIENLRAMDNQMMLVGKRVCVFSQQDSFDSSRIFLTDHYQKLLQGFPIALVPTRDFLVLFGSEDSEGLKIALDMAEKEQEKAYPVSGLAFIFKEGQWQPWLPVEADQLYPRLKAYGIRTKREEYEEQKLLIQSAFTGEEKNAFLSSYTVIDLGNGKKLSSVSWGPGMDALLPKTDLMFFMGGDLGKPKIVASAPWDKAFAIVGKYMEPQEFYPPRWRVRSFPVEEELTGIGLINLSALGEGLA